MTVASKAQRPLSLHDVADRIREMRPSEILMLQLDELLAGLVDEARRALEFYADPHEGIWEPCEDNGEHGLYRFYITGTCHPREPARRAVERLSLIPQPASAGSGDTDAA